jgi:hypothetical protein
MQCVYQQRGQVGVFLVLCCARVDAYHLQAAAGRCRVRVYYVYNSSSVCGGSLQRFVAVCEPTSMVLALQQVLQWGTGGVLDSVVLWVGRRADVVDAMA